MVKPRKISLSFKWNLPGSAVKVKTTKKKIKKKDKETPDIYNEISKIPMYANAEYEEMMDALMSNESYVSKTVDTQRMEPKRMILNEPLGFEVERTRRLKGSKDYPYEKIIKQDGRPTKSRKPKHFSDDLDFPDLNINDVIEKHRNMVMNCPLESLDPELNSRIDEWAAMQQNNLSDSQKLTNLTSKDITMGLDSDVECNFSNNVLSVEKKNKTKSLKFNNDDNTLSPRYEDQNIGNAIAKTEAFIEENKRLANEFKFDKKRKTLFSFQESPSLDTMGNHSETSKWDVNNDPLSSDAETMFKKLSEKSLNTISKSKRNNNLKTNTKLPQWLLDNELEAHDSNSNGLTKKGQGQKNGLNISSNTKTHLNKLSFTDSDSDGQHLPMTKKTSKFSLSHSGPLSNKKEKLISHNTDFEGKIFSGQSKKDQKNSKFSFKEIECDSDSSIYDSDLNNALQKNQTFKKKEKSSSNNAGFDVRDIMSSSNPDLTYNNKEAHMSKLKNKKSSKIPVWNTNDGSSLNESDFDDDLVGKYPKQANKKRFAFGTNASQFDKYITNQDMYQDDSDFEETSKSSKIKKSNSKFQLKKTERSVIPDETDYNKDSDHSSMSLWDRNKMKLSSNFSESNFYDGNKKRTIINPSLKHNKNSSDWNFRGNFSNSDSELEKEISNLKNKKKNKLATKKVALEDLDHKTDNNNMKTNPNSKSSKSASRKKKIKKEPPPVPQLEVIGRHEWFVGFPLTIKPLQTPVTSVVEDYNTDVDRCYSLEECKERLHEIQKRAIEEGKLDLPCRYGFIEVTYHNCHTWRQAKFNAMVFHNKCSIFIVINIVRTGNRINIKIDNNFFVPFS